MLIDHELLLADGQAITADAESAYYVDLKSIGQDIAQGTPLYVVVIVDTTFDTAEEDGTLDISVQTHDDTSFSTGTMTVGKSGQFAEADLTAGRKPIVIPLAANIMASADRYLRAYFDVGSHNFTAGALTAWVTTEVPNGVFPLAPS